MLELHDAGVILHPRAYSDGLVGWREFPYLGGTKFVIHGEDIAHLAEAFGLALGKFSIVSHTREGEPRKTYYRVSDHEFSVRRGYLEVGRGHADDWEGSHIIEKIWAREDNGCLHIRTRCFCEDAEEGRIYYEQRVTYSGSYTIWWSAEDITPSEEFGS